MPQTDAELADASLQSLGAFSFLNPMCRMAEDRMVSEYAPQSKFRAALLLKDELLKNAITSYLGTASDFTEADFTLVFSPALTTPKHEERSSKFIGER